MSKNVDNLVDEIIKAKLSLDDLMTLRGELIAIIDTKRATLSAKNCVGFHLGQKVLTSESTRPKWMAGLKATIIKINRKKCVISASKEDNPQITDKVKFGNTVQINFPHYMLTPITTE